MTTKTARNAAWVVGPVSPNQAMRNVRGEFLAPGFFLPASPLAVPFHHAFDTRHNNTFKFV